MDRGTGRKCGRERRSHGYTLEVRFLAGWYLLAIVVCLSAVAAVAQQPADTASTGTSASPASGQTPVASTVPQSSSADQETPDNAKTDSPKSDPQKKEDSTAAASKPDAAKPQQPKEGVEGSFDEVHIKPIKPEEKPEEKASSAAGAKSPSLGSMTGVGVAPSNSALKSAKAMRVDVNLVLVPVTITDEMNRLVTGLERDNFVVMENGERQNIRHFSSEDAPVSIGVIFDMSGSMKDKMERAKEAVVEFFKTANPEDEFFMIAFNEKPEVISDFTNSIEQIQSDLVYALPKGRTALMDAIYLGLAKMRQARNQKKALLIVSDGGDNHSRYTENEIKSLVREADVQIYAIGIFGANPSQPEEVAGPVTLAAITDETGGRTFTIDNPNELTDVATKIGIELRNQYVLGYRPSKPVRDGKWRKIKVKLNAPKGLPPLTVHSKTGYYAPTD